MFENFIGFFKRIGKKDGRIESKTNKDEAKERLHLVLMQDRANVSADFLDMMRQEIIDVIKKYIEVDEKDIDVRLTNKQNGDGTTGAPALYANIPIKSIKNETKKIAKEEKKIEKENEDDSNKEKVKENNEKSKEKEETKNKEQKEDDNILKEDNKEIIEEKIKEEKDIKQNEQEKEKSSAKDTNKKIKAKEKKINKKK